MSVLAPLAPLRSHAGTRLTTGLDDALLERLAATHPALESAIAAAADAYAAQRAELAGWNELDYGAQNTAIHDLFVNFHADDAVNPDVALTTHRTWVATLKGALMYDAGGYAKLGFGHAPAEVLAAAAASQV